MSAGFKKTLISMAAGLFGLAMVGCGGDSAEATSGETAGEETTTGGEANCESGSCEGETTPVEGEATPAEGATP